MNRAEFDSTLDEIVDVNMRLVEHTAAHRQHESNLSGLSACAPPLA